MLRLAVLLRREVVIQVLARASIMPQRAAPRVSALPPTKPCPKILNRKTVVDCLGFFHFWPSCLNPLTCCTPCLRFNQYVGKYFIPQRVGKLPCICNLSDYMLFMSFYETISYCMCFFHFPFSCLICPACDLICPACDLICPASDLMFHACDIFTSRCWHFYCSYTLPALCSSFEPVSWWGENDDDDDERNYGDNAMVMTMMLDAAIETD